MESKASKAKSAAHDAAECRQPALRYLRRRGSTKKNTKNHDVATDVMPSARFPSPRTQLRLRSVDALRVSSGADWQSITPITPGADR